MELELVRRLRRNRSTSALRNLVREVRLHPHDLVYPLFFHQEEQSIPVDSMPGVFRHSPASLEEEVNRASANGIQAFALFPSIPAEWKDAQGSVACTEKNILFATLERLRDKFPDLLFLADVALDPYTDHGHDGVLDHSAQQVDNDRTVEILCQLAVAEARAGAGMVAPSDMMDGRVAAIRKALDQAGFCQVGILSYAAKFASAFYGPFRDAVGSKIGKDAISKAGYQLDPSNSREALLEVELDLEEGADMVMVKPAGPYLDVLRQVAEISPVPVAAYQVSGEYAQIHAAARLGWLSYEATRNESLLAIKRAGADLIFTYFAREVAGEIL